MTALAAIDLTLVTRRVAAATDGYAAVVVVRYDEEGKVVADSCLPVSAHPIEHMAVALLQEGAARAQAGADAGCSDCGAREDRMRRALAILNEGLDAPAVSGAAAGEKVH